MPTSAQIKKAVGLVSAIVIAMVVFDFVQKYRAKKEMAKIESQAEVTEA